jgi:hypothetical protein
MVDIGNASVGAVAKGTPAQQRHGAEAERTPSLEPDRSLDVPDMVGELRLDLSRERLIRVVGYDKRGNRVERHLKITGKGRLLLV